MKEIKVSPLSRDNFAQYGQIIDLNDLGPSIIDTAVVQFWKQQVEVDFEGGTMIQFLKNYQSNVK
jgi:ureidoglycolate hydrolase